MRRREVLGAQEVAAGTFSLHKTKKFHIFRVVSAFALSYVVFVLL